MRHLIGEILEEEGPVTVVDMEAGLEHLSRGTGRYVDTLLVVMEPYFKALETARRATELAHELELRHVFAVANKLRDERDREAVRAYADQHGLALLAEIPYDDSVRRADLDGRAPIELGDSPAVVAVGALATRLGFGADVA